MLLLLEQEELSVAELQEILAKGQSQISTHLAQLKQAGLVDDRRTGKNAFYRLTASAGTDGSCCARPRRKIPEAAQDQEALHLVLRKRQDQMRRYFDELAGKFGRAICAGTIVEGPRRGAAEADAADGDRGSGRGRGHASRNCWRSARRQVIAIDNSEKMVEFGVGTGAQGTGIANLEYRLGDLEDVPIRSGTVDLAFLQPGAASRGASGAGDRRGVADSEAAAAGSRSSI